MTQTCQERRHWLLLQKTIQDMLKCSEAEEIQEIEEVRIIIDKSVGPLNVVTVMWLHLLGGDWQWDPVGMNWLLCACSL